MGALGGWHQWRLDSRVATTRQRSWSIRRSAGCAVDDRLVDQACFDTPVRRDRLVVTGLDQMLESLLKRLGQRGALLDGPTVRRRIEGLAGLLELSGALLDRVQGHRRIRRH